MFQEMRNSDVRALRDAAVLSMVVDEGQEYAALQSTWISISSRIVANISGIREEIFSCQHSRYENNMDVSNIEPYGRLRNQDKGTKDLYLRLAIEFLIREAKSQGKARLLISTYMLNAYDHFLELGFKIVPKGTFSTSSAQGYMKL
jgi:hypothetical protein